MYYFDTCFSIYMILSNDNESKHLRDVEVVNGKKYLNFIQLLSITV